MHQQTANGVRRQDRLFTHGLTKPEVQERRKQSCPCQTSRLVSIRCHVQDMTRERGINIPGIRVSMLPVPLM
jgi:hypothetical protein